MNANIIKVQILLNELRPKMSLQVTYCNFFKSMERFRDYFVIHFP